MRELIVCDSCCDFTATERLNSSFYKVPATVFASETRLIDDKDFRQEALFAALEIQSLELKLSFPEERAYLEAFACGAQEIYVVTASAALGEHYETASRARRQFVSEHPEVSIHVFNTRTTGVGELLAVRKISRMLRSGCTFRQIVQSVESFILEIRTLLLVETAKPLREHGKLGPMRPFGTDRLVLGMDLQGNLRALGGALTEKAAERRLLRLLEKRADCGGKTCLLAHCGCPQRAKRLAQALRKAGMFDEIVFSEMGAVNSLLLSRGAIMLAY